MGRAQADERRLHALYVAYNACGATTACLYERVGTRSLVMPDTLHAHTQEHCFPRNKSLSVCNLLFFFSFTLNCCSIVAYICTCAISRLIPTLVILFLSPSSPVSKRHAQVASPFSHSQLGATLEVERTTPSSDAMLMGYSSAVESKECHPPCFPKSPCMCMRTVQFCIQYNVY